MNKELSFGQIIKEYRRLHDLTQAELARRVGCAAITIRKTEANALRPSVQIAERLAMVLNIPLEERAAFIRLGRMEALADQSPPPMPTPPVSPEEIGREDLTGRAIKGYELGERIGSGGFGAVYRAVQPLVDREVAVKIILPQYANHPDFIRRFEAEAQLVARLEHPYIVPLYDYWREPGVAYLVMRLLRGGSLEGTLKDGPLSLEAVVRLLEQIGAALHVAHRVGVVHRDIKPANVLLDEDNNAYLADFGIAKNLGNPNWEEQTQLGAIMGSPAYLSPEQVRSEPVRPQTDIYCLGVMLYEMLTGHKPFRAPTPIALIQKHLEAPLPPLATYRPNLPVALDPVLQRATAKTMDERYPDVDSLVADVRQALAANGAPAVSRSPHLSGMADEDATLLGVPDLENPYKGLRAFGEADADDFYGRDTLVQQLLGRLGEVGEPAAGAGQDLARFLAVVGPSGCGKSSVVRAGLAPALRRGGLPDSENWFIVEMLPGAHPLEELEAALLRIAVNPPDSLLAQLQENERGLVRAVRRVLPADESIELVLVIDQFEEVFTLVEDEDVRAHFLDSLVTAVLEPRSRVRVIITLRADFTDRPLQYVDFGELIRQRAEFVLPLTPDELEQAIIAPAERCGLILEPGLASTIIREVGDQPGTLPLLQYTLTELFERREGRTLTLNAYQAIGGVYGSLARRADELYDNLDKPGQEMTRQLFLRLVTLGEGTNDGFSSPDTRRRVLRSELTTLTPTQKERKHELPSPSRRRAGGGEGEIDSIINTFGKYRLLTFDHDPISRESTVEVAHEALLREWARLRDWLTESRSDLRQQRALAAATQAWQEAGQDASFLLHGTRLTRYEEWAAQTRLALTTHERAFLETSLAERDRQQAAEQERQARELALQQRATSRLRWLVVGLTTFLLLTAGLAMFAFSQQVQAQTNFIRAEAQRLAAEANTLVQAGDNAEVVALLALKSMETQYSPQGDAALQAAAGLDYPQQIFAGQNGSVWAVDFSPGSNQVVSGAADGTAQLWDAATGEQMRNFVGHEDEIVSVAFGPDGHTILTGSYDQTARLWDVETGQELHQFVEPDSSYVDVAYSPDGQFVLTGTGGGGVAHLWLTNTGEQVQTFTVDGEVSSVAVSPDGRLVAVTAGETITLWDIESGELLQTFEGHLNLVLNVAFSPNGQILASSGYDQVARLWDIESGELLQTFEGHLDAVEKVRFSPDGQTLLTVSDDRTARLWELETGQEIRQMVGHAGSIFGAAFAPDGQSVATASFDQTTKLWDIQSRPEWMPLTGIFPGGFANAIDFTADGETVLGTSPTGLILWNSQTGQELRRFDYETPMLSAAMSPDGGQVWGGAANGNLVGWEVDTGEHSQTLTGHEAEVISAAVSPDGRYALTAGASDGTARLWDLAGGEPAHVFSPKAGSVMDVAFSPDGRYALASTASGVGFMWAVDGGELVREFELEGPTGMPSLTMSPDGTTLATGSRFGNVVLFDADTGQQQQVFSGHTDVVRDLAFSPDGTLLLSVSADGTARLWDVATGAELRRYNRRPFTAHSAAFAPDGRSVLIAGNNGVAQRFDINFKDTLNYLCNRLQRDFSPEERVQYGLNNELPTCPSSG